MDDRLNEVNIMLYPILPEEQLVVLSMRYDGANLPTFHQISAEKNGSVKTILDDGPLWKTVGRLFPFGEEREFWRNVAEFMQQNLIAEAVFVREHCSLVTVGILPPPPGSTPLLEVIADFENSIREWKTT